MKAVLLTGHGGSECYGMALRHMQRRRLSGWRGTKTRGFVMPDDQPQYHTGPSACVSLLASVLVLLVIIGISIIVDRYGEAWLGEDINARLAIVETGLKVLVALATALWGFWLLFFLRKRDMVDRDLRNKDADTRNKDADTRNKEAQRENDIVKQRISTEAHQLTMAKGQHEINELRKRIDRQISLSLSIQVDTYIDSKMRTFIATVAITNHGNEATRIVWDQEIAAFTVRAVTFDSAGMPAHHAGLEFFVMATRDPKQKARSHTIRPGAPDFLTFAFQLSEPGCYLLSFRGPTDPNVRKENLGQGILMPTVWTAKRYIYFGDARAAVAGTDTSAGSDMPASISPCTPACGLPEGGEP